MKPWLFVVLVLAVLVPGYVDGLDTASDTRGSSNGKASAPSGSNGRLTPDSTEGVWTDFGPGGMPSRRLLDPDGKGLRVRTGNVERGFREGGYRYWIVRDGNWERFGDNQGRVGAAYHDDRRQVTRFEYRIPSAGYRLVGETPYPSNPSGRSWFRQSRLPK